MVFGITPDGAGSLELPQMAPAALALNNGKWGESFFSFFFFFLCFFCVVEGEHWMIERNGQMETKLKRSSFFFFLGA